MKFEITKRCKNTKIVYHCTQFKCLFLTLLMHDRKNFYITCEIWIQTILYNSQIWKLFIYT